MLEKGEESTTYLYGGAIMEPIIGQQQMKRKKTKVAVFMGTENWMEEKSNKSKCSKRERKPQGIYTAVHEASQSIRPCMKRANLQGRA